MAKFYSPKNKIKKIRKQQNVTIEKLDLKLQGMAYIDQKVVFVPSTLPNEEVVIQVNHEHKNYASAELIEITKVSEQRISALCQHFEDCGGCQVQYLSPGEQLSYKQQALAERLNNLVSTKQWATPIASPDWHYRRRGRIGVYVEKNTNLRLGFRQSGSNDLVQISQCDVFVKPFDTLFNEFRDLIDQLDIRASIGHLECIAADNANVVIFRCLNSPSTADVIKLKTFEQKHQLTILLEENDNKFSWLSPAKKGALYYSLNEMKIGFSAGNFIQVNDQVNQTMVNRAVEWLNVKPTDKVLDLFCGVGNFSLAIAKQAQLVVGVEGVKAMVEQAQSNAEQAGLANCVFYHSNLAEPLSEQQWFGDKLRKKVDKILLDPARDGAMEICKQLSQLQPQHIVYVSCEPASLERDSKVIIEQGYQLEKICVMDMFPHTGHVESMALFVKGKKKAPKKKKTFGR
ncbi:23S rRNA (uracil(1939)-C(5))-methyltransferase RlmD [Psychrobium sp. 1_MG-2023]|uniref:23S rRNA (uracil(1939)-C(5))-methyltransferase RlmD n=1 Tax=Psychrobium sp. 1_MG-2023 TaxID=3062624 RepID=UPI00273328CC|nr:23S rRNA (uracil(1939)-C(5))-methyltransferase RlmD [Psychrobium sp. 1_MG-2023]MDP2560579.1 23S rRNA (uracil(1939)-C(5))-methyltransferase RlmD [Psychrobium sp. 1_MG-2023]